MLFRSTARASTTAHNSGSAFLSLFSSATPVLAVLAIVAAVVLARAVARTSDPWMLVGLSLFLGGALGNLVDNAIRYNRPGGHVAVIVERSDGRFTVSVTDDGPGVPPAELPQLTDRWFRGSTARTRRPDGKGLGLAIANESLARLGMQLTLRTPDEGGLRAEIRGGLT